MSESERPAYRTIREWAGDERPRERLLEHGPGVLSDAELIAIVLRSGMPGENVVDMARGLLESVGGLSGLVRADPKVIQRSRGLGPAKAAQLSRNAKSIYRVEAEAKVRGMALSPFDKKEVVIK